MTFCHTKMTKSVNNNFGPKFEIALSTVGNHKNTN